MDLISKNDVKTIGSIGAGPIGAGWVAYFLSQGLSVRLIFIMNLKKIIFIQC